ncbi:flagellar hook-length control protein FliK [Hasllibacter halocynthiae]|uniref:Flagellar hook-length control protein FliK n=1 Tax=Hasllibacter halocynthiae TaxID=595589 RepID=A0A2T0X2P0_9RHOB|nr:flagellar hook-length control protein FliK [Hasllibacter halocynthiae]
MPPEAARGAAAAEGRTRAPRSGPFAQAPRPSGPEEIRVRGAAPPVPGTEGAGAAAPPEPARGDGLRVVVPDAGAPIDLSARRAVAEAVVRLNALGGGVTELRLDPPELGQLRLSVAPAENGVAVTVAADRPETLELFRRHGDQLLHLLQRETGGEATLDFGGSARERAPPFPPDAAEGPAPPGEAARPAPSPMRLIDLAGGGLDLRL